MPYVQLRFETDADAADAAADCLAERGAVCVSLDAAQDAPVFDTGRGGGELWPRTRVTGLFEAGVDLPGVLAGTARTLGWPAPPPHSVETVGDNDWEAEVRRQFRAQRFGRRLIVRPGWEPAVADGALEIVLDPGLAFGTGSHATTAQCLTWLDGIAPLAGRRVIDFGCGSGILAIAAALLGAAHVLAVDIDPQALVVTRANAERNGVAGRIDTGLPDLAEGARCDLLLANILLEPLLQLAPLFARLVEPGGRIALTGLLAEQAPRCAEAYAADFELAPAKIDSGWAFLHGARRAC